MTERIERAKEVVKRLSSRYNRSLVERIGRGEPYRVFVATILSQRTRDEVTERVAEKVLKKWGDVKSLAEASVEDVRRAIKEVGLAPSKAHYLVHSAQMIVKNFNSKIPRTEKELLSLPGIGQKTAGCILVYAYGLSAIPVDTHVHRISNLLGLVSTKTPEQTKKELQKLLPKELWKPVNRIFVLFGREVCCPNNPRCSVCPIEDVCPSSKSKRNGGGAD